MKNLLVIRCFIVLMSLFAGAATLRAQGTAFTYQGRLVENGSPANGIYELRFTIYDSTNTPGVVVAGPLTNPATAVSNGLFTATLDFGAGVFEGDARWLEIGVKSNGVAGAHIPLTPRQALTATPYAIHSSSASVAASVAAGGVTSAAIANGAVTATKIAPGAVSQLDAPDGSPLNAVLVSSNGFVGLGTTAPQAGLHLATGPQMYDGIWRFRIKDGAVGYTNLGFVVSVAVSGTLAVASANTDSAVTVLNLSNSSSPVKQSELRDGVNGFNDLGGAYGLALSSNLLAVTAYLDNAVTLVDLSTPTNPVLRATLKNGVGGFNELSGAWVVALRGSLLAVGGNDAVTLVDVSNPAAPVLRAVMKDGVGGFDYLSGPASMAFSSNLLAVVAFQDQAVNLIDVSNPAAPVLLSTIREGVGGFGYIGQLQGLALFGNTLAFGSWSSGVAFFADISNPAAPLQKSAVGIGTGVRSLAIRGNLLAAAIGDGNNVTLIDVTDPASPVVRGVIPDIESTSGFEGIVTLAFTSSGFLFFGSAANSAIGLLGFGVHQTTLSSDGWVGVGTSLPQAPLHVRGSVLVENASVVSLQGNQVELGLRASASGSFATAIGTDARAEGNFSVVSGGVGNRVVVGATDASIGGGRNNINAAVGATISGGNGNTIVADANYASIGGGRLNSASGQSSTVAGGLNNRSAGIASFVGGGEGNFISNAAPHAVIAGGIGNRSDAGASFIGGGSYNVNNGPGAFIGGGIANRADNFDAVIGGGAANVNAGYRSFIGSGEGNSISNSGPYSSIGGGYGNIARGNSSTVGGGGINSASGLNATVPGGAFSDALGDFSFASGRRAKASHPGAFVWADSTDADFTSTLNDQFSVRASGGVRLVTSGAGATLDGQPVLSGTVSSAQLANGSVTAAKIPTGQVVKSLNSLMDNVTLTAGTNVTITPSGNTLQIAATFTGPVSDSQLSSNIARLNAPAAFTGPVTATNAANSFSGTFAGNGGGLTNLSAANLSGSVPSAALNSVPAANLNGSVPPASLTSVPAGSLTGTIADARLSANVALLNANQAFTGNNSFSSALGLGTANPAAMLHLYSTDNPTTFRIQSTGTPGFGRIEFVSNPQGDANEWRPGYIQSLDAGGFTGGLGFFVNGTGVGNKFGDVEVMRVLNGNVAIAAPATVSFGSNTRQMLNLWGTQYGVGVQSSTVYFRTDNASGSANGFAWYSGGVHNNTAQNSGGGATLMKVDGTGLTVNGVVVSASDRNIKAGFAPVDSRAVLEKVVTLPITRWHFTNDSTIRHVGPMAQDFYAAFGVGPDDKHIATVDADGVALAAIQGLNQKLEAEVKAKDARINELEKRLSAIESLLKQ